MKKKKLTAVILAAALCALPAAGAAAESNEAAEIQADAEEAQDLEEEESSAGSEETAEDGGEASAAGENAESEEESADDESGVTAIEGGAEASEEAVAGEEGTESEEEGQETEEEESAALELEGTSDSEDDEESSGDSGDVTEIEELGADYAVSIQEAGEKACFVYTPSESGYYKFYTEGDEDTYAYLYLEDESLEAYSDDDGEEMNAMIVVKLEAGTSCYLELSLTDSEETGDFTFTAEEADYDEYYAYMCSLGDPFYEAAVEGTAISGTGSFETSVIESEDIYSYFIYTPEEDGYYSFSLESYSDGEGTVYYPSFYMYDSDWEMLDVEFSDEDDPDIWVVNELEGGAVYYLAVGFWAYSEDDDYDYEEEQSVVFTLTVESVSEDDYSRYLGVPAYSDAVNGTLITEEGVYETEILEEEIYEYSYFVFVPEKSGTWSISIPAYTEDGVTYYPYLYLIDSGWGLMDFSDAYADGSAVISAEFEAGETYYLAVGFWCDYEDEYNGDGYAPAQFEMTVKYGEDVAADDSGAIVIADSGDAGTVIETEDNVQTGDPDSMGLWIVLMIAAGAAAAGIFGRKKLAD